MNNIRFIIKNYHLERLGIGNILKCLISALSVNDDTVIECYDDYIYGQYDTILDDKFIYRGQTDKQLEIIYTCRLLILKNEENLQKDLPNEEWFLGGLNNPKFHYLFSFSKRIDWYYDTNLIDTNIKNRIFQSIDKIIFKPIIYDIVNQTSNKFKNDKTLGISIRTWKGIHEISINRLYNFETYIHKIEEILNIHKEINMIVLSIDNLEFINKYIEYFKNRNIEYIILEKSSDINDIQFAISKGLILSKCNYFIGNRSSTFTELVFWFSKHSIKVYTVY